MSTPAPSRDADGDRMWSAEDAVGRLLEAVSSQRWLAPALLLALALVTYFPGVLALPPVDRTEVVWAESTRAMVERGDWRDPRFGETVHQFRPIGTFWVQGLAASLAGRQNARNITVYRLPSLIAVTLAVLAVFWLSAPLAGAGAAFLAAALFAVSPLTVLVSQLAIAEGLSLLPAAVAMLALLRLYAGRESAPPWLAPLFWAALGAGMLLNALQVPILVLVTLGGLAVADRDVRWLKFTRPLLGVPLAFLIAAPWIYVRIHQDGVPFSGMGWRELLGALGGSQDMKLRAWPGTFLLAVVVGFLPGTALLVPAVARLWSERNQRTARFLLAWAVGYLVYLEAISSKPGTYTVQLLFPALALAVAMLLVRDGDRAPASSLVPWPPLAALLALLLLSVPYVFARQIPSVGAAVLASAVALLFAWSAREGRAGRLRVWAVTGIGALGLFAVTLLGTILPSIDVIWPARQLERAVAAACAPGTGVALLGFREPSGVFVLGADRNQSPEAIAANGSAVRIVERRMMKRLPVLASDAAPPLGCVAAYNVMRGCPLAFTLLAPDRPGACTPNRALVCDERAIKAVAASSKDCD